MTAPARNTLKSAAMLFAIGGVIIAAAGMIYLFATPKIFRASARIKIIEWVQTKDLRNPTDLGPVYRECDLLRSDAMLDQTITNLGLIQLWDNRYHPAIASNLDMTRARLKSKLSIQPGLNSSIIGITVTSEDRDETSKIANELARIYLDFRQARHRDLLHDKLDSLKQEWDAQSEKIRTAQTALDKATINLMRENATNETKYYDATSYEALQSKRVDVESNYISLDRQLTELKKMDPQGRIGVLSTGPDETALNPIIQQLAKAKSDLLHARLNQAEDSQEVKDAAIAVDALNQKLTNAAVDTMATKETDLARLKSELSELDSQSKHASTNLPPQTPVSADYKKAQDELSRLRKERDELEKKMNDQESEQAIRPKGLTADLIDSAEVPSGPIVPERRVAMGTIGIGGCIMIAGLLLLIFAGQAAKRRVAR
jgi:uncharacterized protein involved in exopolysaccharide biosynthesis